MITILHGKDAFSIAEEVERLTEELVAPDWRALNLSVFQGTTGIAEIATAARSVPFFGDRLVVVRDCPWFNPASSKGRELAPEDVEGKGTDAKAVVALLQEGLPPGCNLVLVVGHSIHGGMTTSKAAVAAQKAGRARIVEFAGPDPYRKQPTYAWVERRARALGGTIAPDAAEFLVDRLGQDRYQLDQELRKLTSFAEPRPVSRRDVEILSPPGEADVFKLVEHIMAFRAAEAIAALRKLVVHDHPLKVLATMATLMRVYLHEKALVERRRSVDDIAAATRRAPGRVRLDLELLRGWTSSRLLDALGLLGQADRDLKQTSGNDRLVMERLIAELVAPKARN